MKEVKPPKKPLMYYYSIALMVLLLFNFIAVPWMAERQVKEVDYGALSSVCTPQARSSPARSWSRCPRS